MFVEVSFTDKTCILCLLAAGQPGPVSRALFKLLQESYKTAPLTPIPSLY